MTTLIVFLSIVLVVMLVFQYIIMITFGLLDSKSKSDFWYQMIPYQPYFAVIKGLVCSAYKCVKVLYHHYKNLP